MSTQPAGSDTQATSSLGAAASTTPPPASSTPAPASTTKTIHPGLTLKGALSTITGILTAISAAGAVALNIATGLHVGFLSADLTYAADAETVAMAGVHALAVYFTST